MVEIVLNEITGTYILQDGENPEWDRHSADIITSNEITYGLQDGTNTISEIDILRRYNERSRTICSVAKTQQSDRLSGGIKRSRTFCRRENAAVRSTFYRHQIRSCTLWGGKNAIVRSTFCRRQKRGHILSVRAVRTQQSDPHSVAIKRVITYGLQGDKNTAVRSTFCRHQKRDYILSIRAARTAVRPTFCRHLKSGHVRSAGRQEHSSQIHILQTTNDFTYDLQRGQYRNQIHIPDISKDITYDLQERGTMQQSNPHFSGIKKDHVRPAGRGKPSSQIHIL